jgi:hypothetical protein
MLWSDRQGRTVNVDGAAILVQSDDGACVGTGKAEPEEAAPRSLPVPCELHLQVRYKLSEYVSFMWQHGGFLIRRRRIGWPASLYMRIRSTAAAALNFMLLGRGRRTYEITIDEHGIVRTSDTGVTLIGWEDVSAIRSYTRGFMLVLQRGTLPIPFRCLNGTDMEAMRCLAAARKAGPASA